MSDEGTANQRALRQEIIDGLLRWSKDKSQHLVVVCNKGTHRSVSLIQLLRAILEIEVQHLETSSWIERKKIVEWDLEHSPYVSAWISNLT